MLLSIVWLIISLCSHDWLATAHTETIDAESPETDVVCNSSTTSCYISYDEYDPSNPDSIFLKLSVESDHHSEIRKRNDLKMLVTRLTSELNTQCCYKCCLRHLLKKMFCCYRRLRNGVELKRRQFCCKRIMLTLALGIICLFYFTILFRYFAILDVDGADLTPFSMYTSYYPYKISPLYKSPNDKWDAPPFAIDVVYSWSGAKKNDSKYLSNVRQRNNNELKYSLRSIFLFCHTFVRKIWIIVPDHTINDISSIDWINIQKFHQFNSNGKINKFNNINNSIIESIEFYPQSKLFAQSKSNQSDNKNSNAIEMQMKNMIGLANHFIYLCDDFFIGRPLTWHWFFTENGLPRWPQTVYNGYLNYDKIKFPRKKDSSTYDSIQIDNNNNNLNFAIPARIERYASHYPRALTIDLLNDFEMEYPEWFEFVSNHKQRWCPELNLFSNDNKLLGLSWIDQIGAYFRLMFRRSHIVHCERQETLFLTLFHRYLTGKTKIDVFKEPQPSLLIINKDKNNDNIIVFNESKINTRDISYNKFFNSTNPDSDMKYYIHWNVVRSTKVQYFRPVKNWHATLEKLLLMKPYTFCINDAFSNTESVYNRQVSALASFFEKYYGIIKMPFEKETEKDDEKEKGKDKNEISMSYLDSILDVSFITYRDPYKLIFKHPNSIPLLASFHGSMNTYTRLLIEYLTKFYTGSVYRDEILRQTSFFEGEYHCNYDVNQHMSVRDVVVIKMHPEKENIEISKGDALVNSKHQTRKRNKCIERELINDYFVPLDSNVNVNVNNNNIIVFKRFICIVRDPFNAIWSGYQLYRGFNFGKLKKTSNVHILQINHSNFNKTDFQQFISIKNEINRWMLIFRMIELQCNNGNSFNDLIIKYPTMLTKLTNEGFVCNNETKEFLLIRAENLVLSGSQNSDIIRLNEYRKISKFLYHEHYYNEYKNDITKRLQLIDYLIHNPLKVQKDLNVEMIDVDYKSRKDIKSKIDPKKQTPLQMFFHRFESIHRKKNSKFVTSSQAWHALGEKFVCHVWNQVSFYAKLFNYEPINQVVCN